MVLQIELTAEGKRALAQLRENVAPQRAQQQLATFFDREASIIAGQISRKIGSGGLLHRRTGNLARSIVGFASLVDGRPGFEVGVVRGPALRYALVQELGTKGKNPESPIPDIVPRQAKALAIPVGPALTPAGVERYEGPRNYPEPLSFRPSRKPNVVGVLVTEGEETAYILVRSVAIAPKHYLQDGVEGALPDLVVKLEGFLVRLAEGGAA